MKKLMTLMGVTAFALGAFADAYVANKVGFENYTTGNGVTNVTELYNNVSNAKLWYCADGDGDSKVEVYASDAAKYNYGSSTNLVGGPGSQYLSVSTSGNNPLYRALANTEGTGLKPLSLVAEEELGGRDIVADTLVQFTASPNAQTPESGAKFALWLLGEDPAEVASPKTNLVVTAGKFVGSTLSSTNYNLTVEADVLPDQWHRVTVRAINGIAPKGVHVGFVVYIDGKIASCADDYYDDMLGSFDGKLTTEAFILKDRKQLFLSMVPSSDNDAKTLAGVGFQGTGKVDDLSIVDGSDAPSFVAATTGFVITWSEGVVWFKVGDQKYTTAEIEEGYVIVEPVGGAVAITDVQYANSYRKGTWTADGATLNGETFTLSGNVASGEIVATTSVFEINGTPYKTFGAALAAAAKVGGAVTIKAVADFSVMSDTFDEFQEYEVNGDVTIDLAGFTITDNRDDSQGLELFYVNEAGTLTVKDSVGDGKIVSATTDADNVPLFGGSGTIVIGAATGDEGVTVDGTIGSATLVRGFFNDENAGQLVDEGSTISAEPEAGFYTVEPGSTPPEPTTKYTVTFSYTVPGAESATVSSVEVDDGTLLSALTWPTLPTETGYTAAWPTYAEGATVTADVTFTATYSANTYTVTFYTNSVEYATATYTYGDASTYTAPADPDVDGFTFGGWFTDNGTFKTAFDFDETVADNTRVYAKLTEKQPPEDDYPSYIPTEDAAAKAKYDSWAEYAGVTTAAAAEELEEAYLLNCKPDEVAAAKAAFKFTSITKDGDTWVTTTTTGYNNRDYNGTVTVKSYSDVGCTTESEAGTFFRATLTLK